MRAFCYYEWAEVCYQEKNKQIFKKWRPSESTTNWTTLVCVCRCWNVASNWISWHTYAAHIKWDICLTFVWKEAAVCCLLRGNDHSHFHVLTSHANTIARCGRGGFSLYSSPISRDLLKQFTTMELMRWSSLVEDYGKELREGSPDSPATDVFSYSEEGEKRWKDLKNRVVEHVSPTVKCRLFSFGADAYIFRWLYWDFLFYAWQQGDI